MLIELQIKMTEFICSEFVASIRFIVALVYNRNVCEHNHIKQSETELTNVMCWLMCELSLVTLSDSKAWGICYMWYYFIRVNLKKKVLNNPYY